MIRLLHLIIIVVIINPLNNTYPIEIEGFDFKEKISLQKQQLVLNGIGVRTVTIFKIKAFAAGLYLIKQSNNAAMIFSSKEPKRIHLRFLKNLSASMVANAWESELLERCHKNCKALKEKAIKLGTMMVDFKKKDSLVFDFYTDQVQVLVEDTRNGIILGHDFSSALLSLWIGKKPLSANLKKKLLKMVKLKLIKNHGSSQVLSGETIQTRNLNEKNSISITEMGCGTPLTIGKNDF